MIQTQAINYILHTKDTNIITENSLSVDYFSDCAFEFNYIKQHIDTYGNVPDLETFKNIFPNFNIHEVAETPKYIVEQLREDKDKRTIASLLIKAKNEAFAGDIDSAKKTLLVDAPTALNDKELSCVDIIHDTSRYDRYVEKCNNISGYYFPTCFKELDNLIVGWDRNEELATIVARPGVGKSWVLLKCAESILQMNRGYIVGLYSGEMSEDKVGYRFDTLHGNVENSQITHGNVSVQNKYKEYIDNLSNLNGQLKILTPTMLGGHAAGVSDLRAFVEKEKLDILCIDQHSLLEDDRKAKDPVSRASNISRDLKNLQVLEKIPIIAVSQQNRGSGNNGEDVETELDVSRISQSDRIGQDSTTVLFLEQKDDILTVHLAKSRDSVSGKRLKYAIDLNRGIFQYIPVGDEQAATDLSNTFSDDFDNGSDFGGEEVSPF